MLRFAASPTGDMHINDLRIAILNYLVAQQRHEGFIVRIADTNKSEIVEGKDTEIMHILEKFALKYDAVFHQSEHLNIHQTLAIRLLKEQKAFICTCNETHSKCIQNCEDKENTDYTQLRESKIPFVLRIKQPQYNIEIDELLEEKIVKASKEIDDFIILRQDATPSEIFASACDDMLSGISLVIESKKHLPDTAKTLHIKTALGYTEKTEYIHLKDISDTPELKSLFEEGYIPDTIINYLLALSNTDLLQDIFTLPQAIERFKLKDIPTSEVKFEMDKFCMLNREHLKSMDDRLLSMLFGFADADIGKLAKLYLDDVCTLKELQSKIDAIFAPKDFQGKWANQMRTLETLIQDAPMYHHYNAFESYLLKETGLTGKAFFTPLRLLLTGEEEGPELAEIYPLIKPYILEIAS